MWEFENFFQSLKGVSLQKRQHQYEVEMQRKYEQELEDLKAKMQAIEDMFNGHQSIPIDHQTRPPPPEEVHDHQMAPSPDLHDHQTPPSTKGGT